MMTATSLRLPPQGHLQTSAANVWRFHKDRETLYLQMSKKLDPMDASAAAAASSWPANWQRRRDEPATRE